MMSARNLKNISISIFLFGILFIPNFSYALTTLLEDDFTGTTIDQSKWTMVGGTEGVDYIQNGNINVRNSGGTSAPGSATSLQSATSFAKGDDLTISANVTSASGYAYLGYGDYSSGTYYYIIIHSVLGYDGYIRKAGGAYSNNTSCGSYTAGAKVSMKITATSFEVYKNDVYQCAVVVDGSAPTMTTHPIFLKGATTTAFFDNILVTNTASAPAATVPDAITNLAASEWGNTTTNLTWTAPSNGGSAITDYTVEYRESGAVSWNSFSDGVSASTGATVTGLTNGVTYEFRAFAVNSIGSSSASNTASVTVRAPTAPSTPSAPTATNVFDIDGGQVSVSFSAPSANGSAITSYTVTASSGGFSETVASSPATFSGLDPDTSYTFTVVATNGVGSSSASSASNSVTPSAFPDGTIIWTQRNNSSARNWYDAKISSDGTKIAAVVNNGYIYTSTDSGANWTERTGAGSRAWTAIASSSDGTKLVALGTNTYIYTSTDSGANWTERTGPGSRFWVDVSSSSDGVNLVATNSSGGTYYSTDSGATWNLSYDSDKSWLSVSVSPDASKIYLGPGATSGSYIEKSTDFGANFTTFVSSEDIYYADIDTSNDGTTVYAIPSNSGYILKSTNSATSWSTLTGSGIKSWRSIATSSDANHIVASSYSGVIVSSIDGGANWVTDTNSTTWRGVDMSLDGTKVVAVREGGYIYTGVIDTTAPTITNISSDKADGSYGIGEVIDIDVTFSETVTSTGNVTITLETGTTDRTCTFTVTSSTTGTCNYTVVEGDETSDLTVSSVSGTIKDESLNAMTDFAPATNLAANKALVIDAVFPVISSVASSVTNTTATITWTTDTLSSSILEYGLTSTYNTFPAESDTSPRVLSHSVSLTNLVRCTTYYYRVKSKDSVLNLTTGSANLFTTTGCVGDATVDEQVSESITNDSGGTTSLTVNSTVLALEIPPALTGVDTVFQIKSLDKDTVFTASGIPSGVLEAVDYSFDLKALTDIDTLVSSFNDSVEVSLTYEDNDISNVEESSLVMYRYDGDSWNPLTGCSINVGINKITCSTTNFSVFSVFATEERVTTSAGGPVPVWLLQQISDRLRLENNKAQAQEINQNNTTPIFNACKKLPDNPKVLKLNNKNNSVKILQEILNCKGYFIAISGVGSKGKETNYFGQKTKEALIKFQKDNNLKGDGILGPITRKLLNKVTPL